MNITLKYCFDRLEKDKQSLLAQVDAAPKSLLNVSSQGRWSVLQILAHLITAERVSLNYMKKKSLGVDQLGNSGIAESIKLLVLKLSQRMPIKYKAPAHVVNNTPQQMSLEEIKIEWNSLRQELKSFLEAIEGGNIRKKIYKHPVVGYLDVRQGLSFSREHILHHWPQVSRLIGKKKF